MTTLKEKISILEEKEVMLIVIDMINGFVKEGKLADPEIAKIIPSIIELIGETKNEGGVITFSNDSHEVDSKEFKVYDPHAIKGTREALVVDELQPYTQGAVIYEKDFVNTMRIPEFREDIERMKRLRKVVVTGCCTDICVMQMVEALLKRINRTNRNIEVIVPEFAVSTFEKLGHIRTEAQQYGLEEMEKSGARIIRRK